ncbi:hypothetical protein CE91St49_21470 [Emergencia timonensis]|nr:hypothetical protein CE91St48_21530 [Emergencia timonensis]BDF12800.1 hypothetical protein CE91St49_21470 [Emergencia timonensis]
MAPINMVIKTVIAKPLNNLLIENTPFLLILPLYLLERGAAIALTYRALTVL